MGKRTGWGVVLTVLLCSFSGAVGCKRDAAGDGSAAGKSMAAPASSAASASNGERSATNDGKASSATCDAEFDYLLPPTAYGDRDMVRTIVVDGPRAFLVTMRDILSIPLTGGTPVTVAQAPGTTLSGQFAMWSDGQRLISQSAAEPIFMELPKAGGEWRTFIDLSPGKRGGGRDAATRILHGIGTGGAKEHAGWADFDGSAFYWTERPAKQNVIGVGRVRTVSVQGGDAKTLWEAPGIAQGLRRAGGYLVFVHTEPPDPAELAKYEAERKAKKYGPNPKGKSSLLSIPVAGGDATRLLGMAQWMSRAVLVTDDETVYASGYLEEDLQKPGVYRVSARGGMVQKLDPRVVSGEGIRYAGGVVLTGSGFTKKGELTTGSVVLAVPEGASEAVQVACFSSRYSTHATAIAENTLLLSVLDGQTGHAAVVRVPLP